MLKKILIFLCRKHNMNRVRKSIHSIYHPPTFNIVFLGVWQTNFVQSAPINHFLVQTYQTVDMNPVPLTAGIVYKVLFHQSISRLYTFFDAQIPTEIFESPRDRPLPHKSSHALINIDFNIVANRPFTLYLNTE